MSLWLLHETSWKCLTRTQFFEVAIKNLVDKKALLLQGNLEQFNIPGCRIPIVQQEMARIYGLKILHWWKNCPEAICQNDVANMVDCGCNLFCNALGCILDLFCNLSVVKLSSYNDSCLILEYNMDLWKKHELYRICFKNPYSIYFKIIISHIKVSPVSPGPTSSSGSCLTNVERLAKSLKASVFFVEKRYQHNYLQQFCMHKSVERYIYRERE